MPSSRLRAALGLILFQLSMDLIQRSASIGFSGHRASRDHLPLDAGLVLFRQQPVQNIPPLQSRALAR
jgi:hypothetical protein